MKEITLFLLNNCPHCKLALRLQEELLEEHPAWRDIPLRMVDEAAEPAYADTFDYYYVPCYYVDGVKVHEGHAERADVEAVFRAAAGEPAGVCRTGTGPRFFRTGSMCAAPVGRAAAM